MKLPRLYLSLKGISKPQHQPETYLALFVEYTFELYVWATLYYLFVLN